MFSGASESLEALRSIWRLCLQGGFTIVSYKLGSMSERPQILAVGRRSKQPPACAAGRARPGCGWLVGV